MGYHCHLYGTVGKRDLGVLLTLLETRVYAEIHRIGKVKHPCDINSLGDKDTEYLITQVGLELSTFPQNTRRRPSQKAVYLGEYRP